MLSVVRRAPLLRAPRRIWPQVRQEFGRLLTHIWGDRVRPDVRRHVAELGRSGRCRLGVGAPSALRGRAAHAALASTGIRSDAPTTWEERQSRPNSERHRPPMSLPIRDIPSQRMSLRRADAHVIFTAPFHRWPVRQLHPRLSKSAELGLKCLSLGADWLSVDSASMIALMPLDVRAALRGARVARDAGAIRPELGLRGTVYQSWPDFRQSRHRLQHFRLQHSRLAIEMRPTSTDSYFAKLALGQLRPESGHGRPLLVISPGAPRHVAFWATWAWRSQELSGTSVATTDSSAHVARHGACFPNLSDDCFEASHRLAKRSLGKEFAQTSL